MLDFTHIQQLFNTVHDPEVSAPVAARAERNLREMIPAELFDKLDGNTPDGPRFKQHFDDFLVGQIKGAYREYYEEPRDNKNPGEAVGKFDSVVPDELAVILDALNPNDDEDDERPHIESAEFEAAIRRFLSGKPAPPKAKPKSREPESEEIEAEDLLPFSILYSSKQIPAEGYAIDSHAVPHGVSGRARKRGPLVHQRYFDKSKKFREGYKLTLPGLGRRLISSKVLAMARFAAERSES